MISKILRTSCSSHVASCSAFALEAVCKVIVYCRGIEQKRNQSRKDNVQGARLVASGSSSSLLNLIFTSRATSQLFRISEVDPVQRTAHRLADVLKQAPSGAEVVPVVMLS